MYASQQVQRQLQTVTRKTVSLSMFLLLHILKAHCPFTYSFKVEVLTAILTPITTDQA